MDKQTQISKLKELRDALKRKESYSKDLNIWRERITNTYNEKKEPVSYIEESEDNYSRTKEKIERRINNDIGNKRDVLKWIFLLLIIAVFVVSLIYIYSNTEAIKDGMREDAFMNTLFDGNVHIAAIYVIDTIFFAAVFVISCIIFSIECYGDVRL